MDKERGLWCPSALLPSLSAYSIVSQSGADTVFHRTAALLIQCRGRFERVYLILRMYSQII